MLLVLPTVAIIPSQFLPIILNLFLCHHILFLLYSLNFHQVSDNDVHNSCCNWWMSIANLILFIRNISLLFFSNCTAAFVFIIKLMLRYLSLHSAIQLLVTLLLCLQASYYSSIIPTKFHSNDLYKYETILTCLGSILI